ncbi:ligand-binding sensor domain-containing protein [Spirosoma endbachense]|uniref:Histidine kinase n=1 Tax=Spirosoma endbachense TaxID=2666025 RepID=A0A6P1VXK7_9BACT|nr:two-component regulator propeller domain-containing protein [Spirosoma endbachense]QHV96439.1 hypothetical protein GJR95_16045 [Spirosoma endbachense]
MYRNRTFCLGLLIFINLPFILIGQQNPHQPEAITPNNFFFTHLTAKNGLSYNLINCLHQDREGYIWVGTFNGLNRFDGQRFVSFKYNRNNPHAIAHNTIIDICEDKSGDLWIATVNGVSHYVKATNSFVNYLPEPNSAETFRNNTVNNILCDRNGTIWATSLGGVFEFDPNRKQFKAYKHNPASLASLSSNAIYRNALVEDPRRTQLWIGSSNGLNCFDTQTKTFTNYQNNPDHAPIFTDRPAYPLAFDQKGNLLVGDYQAGRVNTFNPDTKAIGWLNNPESAANAPRLPALSAIYVDRQNNVWLSAWENKVYHFQSGKQQWIELTHSDSNPASIASNFFWDAIQARDGTLYLGGLYGLSSCRPAESSFIIFNPSDNLPVLKGKARITALVEDNKETVWIATDWNGLIAYNQAKQTYIQYPATASPNDLPVEIGGAFHLTVIEDELWICSAKGVFVFNPKSRQYRSFIELPSGKKNPQNVALWSFQDKRRTIWFNQSARFLVHYNPQTKGYKCYNLDSLSGSSETTNVTAVGEDAAGNVWFGTYMGRLYQYQAETDRFTVHVPNPQQKPRVLQQPINDLWGDPKGNIWMATEGGGLIRFDPTRNQFKAWMENDGLLMDVCNRLLADQRGRLWVGTYEGFTIFDPIHEQVVNTRIDYGQRENNFFSNAQCRLRNGMILYANADKLILIDPAQLTTRQTKPELLVSSIAIFEKSKPLYNHSPPIELSYKENFFTLTFSSLVGPQEGLIEYAYRLTSYDPDWVLSGARTFATYTGVKGGRYLFEVKARQKDGAWSSPIRLPIYIHPPFWETWWFQAMALSVVIGLVVLGVKRREKNLVQQEVEKSAFREQLAASEMKALRSQMNPHFLYNSLNAIRLFVLQNDSDNADKYLVKFARLMRLILDNSRQEWVNVANELEQLQLYLELEQLRFNYKFMFLISVDPNLAQDKTMIPPMIIQPYIENAILHGLAHKKGPGIITVTIQSQAGYLECVVDDDGVGRQRAGELKSKTVSSHKSVGLRVTEDRLHLLGQRSGQQTQVRVIDKKNEMNEPLGTRVIIALPLKIEHSE